ncbi:hypothetical protein [Halalkalibacter sp. APA_J-10(15)]|uniref:hypothetical protein n=1 Tax=Halalkalibacter sp. APA_J-10(15) TaxID=2933805 RepID=UPI001FF401B1|nr:hypothetical protein [Halalkalibacter sp. APA_J-10(15)]MCK0473367.1 hypothetical protein [Halalkalibacter sp. APA_J-10(15)]
MSSNKKQVEQQDEFLKWLEENDPLDVEEEVTISFICIKCKKEDELLDFVVDEFHYDLEEGEEVEVVCLFCGGTMRQARKDPCE